MAKTIDLASYLTDGNGHSASVSGGTVTIPAAAIGLDTSDADDIAEFLNALLRTAAASYNALGSDARPEHLSLSSSTFVVGGSSAQRSYSVSLDIEYSGESVVDET